LKIEGNLKTEKFDEIFENGKPNPELSGDLRVFLECMVRRKR
jgi:hypothetical protein